jgi:hypothetical protein
MNQQKGFSVGELLVGVFLLFVLGIFALPYFLRSEVVGCGGDAPATVRMLSTAQTTYTTNFPDAGFAPNLAVLGGWSHEHGCSGPSTDHACIIDRILGCSEGVGQGWCSYTNGYRYNIQRTLPSVPDQDYWITATRIEANPVQVKRSWSDWLFRRPVKKDKRLRNYCASGDGSVRSEEGPPLTVPYTQVQCARLPLDD